MIHLKEGVRLIGLTPPMTLAIVIVAGVYEREGHELVVTSVTDGEHMRGSLHYVGAAGDFRVTEDMDGEDLRNRIAEALGADFDVVLEGDHIHVEWQPKEAYA